MPDDRRDVIDALLMADHPEKSSPIGELTSTELTNIKNISKPTTLKLFETLRVLGLVDSTIEEGPIPGKVTLKKEFDWLISEDFQKYRNIWLNSMKSTPGLPF
jgi:hypothetical protein